MYELAEKPACAPAVRSAFQNGDVRKIFEFHFPVLKSHLKKKKKEGRKGKINTEAGLYSYGLLR